MNPLAVKLETGTSYTSVGNSLSRFFMAWWGLTENTNILIYTPDSSGAERYKTLAQNFWVPYFSLKYNYELAYLKSDTPGIFVIPIEDGESYISLQENCSISVGDENGISKDIEALVNLGFTFQELWGKWTYKRLWDTLHIHDFSGYFSFTISYWWESVESITQKNLKWDVVISTQDISTIQLGGNTPLKDEEGTRSLIDVTSEIPCFTIFDTIEFSTHYQQIIASHKKNVSFDILGDSQRHIQNLEIHDLAIESLWWLKQVLSETNTQKYIYTKREKLISDFLTYNQIQWVQVFSVQTHVLQSFSQKSKNSKDENIVCICDDILNRVFIKKRVKKKLSDNLDLLMKIQKWDYVVHIDHWVGIFQEIVKKKLWEIQKEYVEIHYQKGDKLFVPITEVSRISKYIGVENPSLTPLSGKIWEKKMAKIHEDIQKIAQELLTNFADRKIRPWVPYQRNHEKMELFQKQFPYTYTPCQSQAIEDIVTDMEWTNIMDRLLVGDVGFWKTEIAFNAIYNAISNGKQAVFIAPLVVLAYEHYEKALERFAGLWVRIGILTRMESTSSANNTLQAVADGKIDLIIGTHRVLGKSVVFKNLWLVVVDEEHKFWVQDKEKIKSIKSDTDMLSMSATPIPRSLNIALSGIRDISILKTPPEWRQNIETLISPYQEKIIQDAWNTEFQRWWQVFFVHNRVENIEVYKKKIETIFPTKKVVVTHGQLPWNELEKRIIDFKQKKYDILLSTTVIENGIDFSNVNTIFINQCQNFGISTLHQLRGRVGRSNVKWYCYLLYKKETLSNESAKRLQTVVNYSYLWSGFELAMRDLEVRGWGDILGIRQSGQAKEIGVSLFLKMLEEKIEELKNTSKQGSKTTAQPPSIDLQISASIADDFFHSETDKIQFYREIESISTIQELNSIRQWISEIERDIPKQTLNLFMILKAKILAQDYGITSIKKVGINYQIDFRKDIELDELKEFLKRDRLVQFQVVTIQRLRAPTKVFENDIKFVQYVLDMFEGQLSHPKIKKKSF